VSGENDEAGKLGRIFMDGLIASRQYSHLHCLFLVTQFFLKSVLLDDSGRGGFKSLAGGLLWEMQLKGF
jgi:hypothetical protein